MAGLQVGQAFGVLLLPGFGISSSSPQVPGHPTSTCDAGVKQTYSTAQKKPNRERKCAHERVQNGYRTGTRTRTERVQNGYRTDIERIRNGNK